MKILGIDFGLSQIGLALSEANLPEPLLVIKNSPDSLKKIAAICQQHQVEKIVIGISEGELAEKTKEFAGCLFLLTQVPFEFEDETLTSRQALVKMIETGKRKKIRREMEDAFAAALILEAYLERKEGDV